MKLTTCFLVLSLSTVFFQSFAQDQDKFDVVIACDSLGKKKEQCVASVKNWEKETGKKAKIIEAPTGSSNRLAWVQQQLAAESPDIDVYQIDTTWAGLLKQHLVALNAHIDSETLSLYNPALIENNTIDGTLYALPWYVDIGLLIYRKDLLEKYNKPVPQTWQELGETAECIQTAERACGSSDLWGFVFTAKAFEGLTCNVNEWISSRQGQTLVKPDGSIHANTPENADTLNMFAKWVGNISPTGVLNYAEEDTRGVFQSGKAVFVRHWPYVISLAEAEESPLKGKIGVAPLPKNGPDGKRVSTLGGWQLAVSKHSKRQKNAIALIKFLTGKEELKKRAIRGNYYPPMPSLYNDPDVRKALPYPDAFLEAFNNVVARPSAQTKGKYNQVSSQVWNTTHSILIGKMTAEKALKKLQKNLENISRKGKNW